MSLKTEILSTHTPALFQAAVRRAAEHLRRGEAVALPTETVYGLAANALDKAAVARIYEIKGRPAHNPIIVHVASLAMARSCARDWLPLADELAQAFWPGPLTLVMPRSGRVPDLVAAGGATVGLRWPAHPFMQAVIRECGFPLAAPSANLSNRLSPTNAGHVRSQLEGKISLVVDGGQSQVGIESTVLDVSVSPPRILRPGMIPETSLAAVAGGAWCRPLAPASPAHPAGATRETGETLRSPGLLPRHYSPRARLVVWEWENDAELAAKIRGLKHSPAKCQVIAHARIPAGELFAGVNVIPHDAEAFARALYAELHRCDEAGVDLIVVEAPPDSPEWFGIADRLRRAATA